MSRKFEGWDVAYLYIHSKGVQLIPDNNPVLIVFFYIIIPTLLQLTYLFSGEVAALFNRNFAGYCAICD